VGSKVKVDELYVLMRWIFVQHTRWVLHFTSGHKADSHHPSCCASCRHSVCDAGCVGVGSADVGRRYRFTRLHHCILPHNMDGQGLSGHCR